MLHELAQFPIRPARQAGESLAGFICRHFGTNGHWIPKALHDAVATVYRSEVEEDRQAAWTLVCKVMGEAPEDYRRLWIDDRFTLPQAQAARLKRHWQIPATRRFRLCPECLRTTGVHLALWDFPLVFACPIHARMLATQCQCGKPIAWAGMRPDWTCACGQALASLSTRVASRSLVHVATFIAAASDLHVPGITGDHVESYRLAQDIRSTYDVLAWLEVLFRELRGPGRPKTPGNAPERWRFGSALDDWPHGLIRLLRRFMKRWHRLDRDKLAVYLLEDSRTLRLLNLLNAATSNDALPTTLQNSLRGVLKDTRYSPTVSDQWIFNPALSTEQRDGKKLALHQWWQGLSDWIEIADGPVHQERTHHLGFVEIAERSSVMLLNGLVAAAEQATAATKFRRLASAWPPTPRGANLLPPDGLLVLINQQLLDISSGHREYLCELTHNATGVTRGAF